MSTATDAAHAIDVDCPVCGVPAHLEVRTTITFPDDVEAIITAMAGRANVIRCAVCGTESRGPTAVRLVADGTTLAESNDPATLRRVALAWANTYMMRATARLMDEIDGRAGPVRDEHGVPLLDTPIALALLHEQASDFRADPGRTVIVEGLRRAGVDAAVGGAAVVEGRDGHGRGAEQGEAGLVDEACRRGRRGAGPRTALGCCW